MKKFSPALITALILTTMPALGHPGYKPDSQRGGNAHGASAPVVHQQSVKPVHEHTQGATPMIIDHPQTLRGDHARVIQPHPFVVRQPEQPAHLRASHETPFVVVHQPERQEHWRVAPKVFPNVWTRPVVGVRPWTGGARIEWNRRDRDDRRWRDRDDRLARAWWLRQAQPVAYVPIFVNRPVRRYIAYWPQQPVYFTPIGDSQAYYSSTCYGGNGYEDNANSCYDYSAPVPTFGMANFVSTPYYNSQVQGVVVAQTGPSLLLLTSSLQPVFVNISPAEQSGYVQGGLRPGTFVDAYGYYSGNTFVATSVT